MIVISIIIIIINTIAMAKKKYCFFRKSAGWKFFYHSPARIVKFVSEYTFLISKTSKKTNKNKKNKRN